MTALCPQYPASNLWIDLLSATTAPVLTHITTEASGKLRPASATSYCSLNQ